MHSLDLKLIDDCFNCLEAKKILLGIIEEKLKHYRIKNLTHQVRYEQPDLAALSKIGQLEQYRDLIQKAIDDTQADRSELKIEANFSIVPRSESQGKQTGTFG